MATSIEDFVPLLVQSRLYTADEARALYLEWQKKHPSFASDFRKFSEWLTREQYTTQYQVEVLLRGHVNSLFLNEYMLLDRIGKGDTARVFRAKHKLGQVVALKVLAPSKANDPALFARFQREARLTSRLKHPNIVRMFHKGVHQGLHYIVMEQLEGENLQSVLQRRGRLPLTEAVRLVYQALQGLQHIHEHGMVHRDLQPANLMLVPPRAPDEPDTTLNATVKILDIGVGRALFDEGDDDDEEGGEIFQTVRGDQLGVPAYTAPEQIRDAHNVDIRADIFTLGVVLYESLGGQKPFAGASLADFVRPSNMMSARPLRELNPFIPQEAQTVVERMLAFDPAQRFTTPNEVANLLQGFLSPKVRINRPAEMSAKTSNYLQWVDKQVEEDEKPENHEEPKGKPQAASGSEAIARPAPVKEPKPPSPSHQAIALENKRVPVRGLQTGSKWTGLIIAIVAVLGAFAILALALLAGAYYWFYRN